MICVVVLDLLCAVPPLQIVSVFDSRPRNFAVNVYEGLFPTIDDSGDLIDKLQVSQYPSPECQPEYSIAFLCLL